MEIKNKKTKTAGKTANKMDKGVKKQYYKVYSIEDLEKLIQEAKNKGSTRNIKQKSATTIAYFEEVEEYEGQLTEVEKRKERTQVCEMCGEMKVYEADNNICEKCIEGQVDALGGKN